MLLLLFFCLLSRGIFSPQHEYFMSGIHVWWTFINLFHSVNMSIYSIFHFPKYQKLNPHPALKILMQMMLTNIPLNPCKGWLFARTILIVLPSYISCPYLFVWWIKHLKRRQAFRKMNRRSHDEIQMARNPKHAA